MPTFYRKRELWDQAYQEAVFGRVYQKRASLYRLMAPKKRRVLTKLLCLRMMQEAYAPADDDFFDAFQDSGLLEAEENIIVLEKKTLSFLDTCRREDKVDEQSSAVPMSTLDEDEDTAVLQHGDKEKVSKRQRGVEELLGLWEQIIDALEEGLDSGDAFSKKMFSGDKLERWYVAPSILPPPGLI